MHVCFIVILLCLSHAVSLRRSRSLQRVRVCTRCVVWSVCILSYRTLHSLAAVTSSIGAVYAGDALRACDLYSTVTTAFRGSVTVFVEAWHASIQPRSIALLAENRYSHMRAVSRWIDLNCSDVWRFRAAPTAPCSMFNLNSVAADTWPRINLQLQYRCCYMHRRNGRGGPQHAATEGMGMSRSCF